MGWEELLIRHSRARHRLCASTQVRIAPGAVAWVGIISGFATRLSVWSRNAMADEQIVWWHARF